MKTVLITLSFHVHDEQGQCMANVVLNVKQLFDILSEQGEKFQREIQCDQEYQAVISADLGPVPQQKKELQA